MLYILLALPFLYCAVVVIYRLYFHPLRSIPGPRLAAATGWYEFYYDIIRKGEFIFELKSLHEKYGPVVRISPREVHVNDLGFYHEVFKQNTPYIKDVRFYHAVVAPYSMMAIIDPVEHKPRRDLMAPFFSKRAIYALDGLLWEKTEKFCQKIAESAGEPIVLQDGFNCLTVDIISKYLLGTSFDMLNEPNFNGVHIRNMENVIANLPLCKHFPILRTVAMSLPESLAMRVAPGFAHVVSHCTSVVKELLDSKSKQNSQADKAAKPQSTGTEDSGLVYQNIYDALLDQDGLTAKGKRPPTLNELIDESILFLSAGTDTTSFSLTMAVYHVLSNPEVKTRLVQELAEFKERCGDRNPSLKDIEQLPYLTGVVKESIRFSQGVPGKLPRVVPSTGAQVGNVRLPPGSVVSVSSYYINHHPDLYPEPFKFWPERWISNPPPDKWFVPFSKGTRSCPGMNLAYAEIYVTLANLFTKFDLQLYKTGPKEMEWKDFGLPLTNDHLKVIATLKE